MSVTQAQFEAGVELVNDPVLTYGHLVENQPDIVLATSGVWHEGGYSLTYDMQHNVTGGTTGVVIDKDSSVKIMHKLGCRATTTALVEMALVKNATFTGGILDSESSILTGSGDSKQSDIIGQANGYIGLDSLWAGDVLSGDEVTVVFKSSVAGTTLEQMNGALFIEELLGVWS